MPAIKLKISQLLVRLTSLVLVAAYILPNHYLPWPGFHSEAMAALAFLLLFAGVLMGSEELAKINYIFYIALVVFVVVGVQRIFGIVSWNSVLWLSFVYVVGFMVSMYIGRVWALSNAANAFGWLVFVWLFAAIISLPLQIMQWLDLDWSTPYINQIANGARPHANIAQPNLLADLYMLALIGLSWLVEGHRINRRAALFLALCLLAGIALTGSRFGWLGLSMLGLVFYFSYRKTQISVSPKVIVFLCVYFISLLFVLPNIRGKLMPGVDIPSVISASSAYIRLQGWEMLVNASMGEFWHGYGWGQTSAANFVGDVRLIGQRGIFTQSHNLFLDFVIWFGYPFGVALGGCVFWLMLRVVKLLSSPEKFYPASILLLLFLHSQIEFPLYYTYFLFPFGLIVGIISSDGESTEFGGWRIFFGMIIWLIFACSFYATVREYFLVERGSYALRYDLKKINHSDRDFVPDLYIFDNLEQSMRLARADDSQLSSYSIVDIKRIVLADPSPILMYKLARAYSLAGEAEESKLWLRQICAKSEDPVCDHFSGLARANP